MSIKNDIFTLDNLWHSLVAIAFVVVCSLTLGSWAAFPAAALASLGLYLREASQVGWDWSLKWSFHKHMEWIGGSFVGFLTAGVCEIVGDFASVFARMH